MTDWLETVRQHGPLVWRTAYRLLGNEPDANDCFQDTFVSAVKLSRRENVRSWAAVLKSIATARALEQLRKRYRDTNRNEEWSDVPVIDQHAIEPGQGVLDEEVANDILRALTQIDKQQAEAFCLIAIEEFSYREAATQLDISISHVGVLLHRAKCELQNLLLHHAPSLTDQSRARKNNGH